MVHCSGTRPEANTFKADAVAIVESRPISFFLFLIPRCYCLYSYYTDRLCSVTGSINDSFIGINKTITVMNLFMLWFI